MCFSCSICTDTFNASSRITSAPCGHAFHQHCLDHWLREARTCPQCRARIEQRALRPIFLNFSAIEHFGEAPETQKRIRDLTAQLRKTRKEVQELKKTVKVEKEVKKDIKASIEGDFERIVDEFCQNTARFHQLDQQMNVQLYDLAATHFDFLL